MNANAEVNGNQTATAAGGAGKAKLPKLPKPPKPAIQGDAAVPSRRARGSGSKSVRSKGAEVVSTSIRMNPGTSILLDWELYLLNANRKDGEPPWSLGEVVELAIQVVYPEWRRLYELSRVGKLPEGRRGEPSRN